MNERLEEIKSHEKEIYYLLGSERTRSYWDWLMNRVVETEKEKGQLVEVIQEIKRILEETPYREYTTNKTRFRLLELAEKGLGEKEKEPI